jgi:5-methylcytosine-specific restriction endonuclease McrA
MKVKTRRINKVGKVIYVLVNEKLNKNIGIKKTKPKPRHNKKRQSIQISFKDQYNTFQWKRKRDQILMRDNRTCQKCGSFLYLEVHHLKYPKNKPIWDIDNKYLITLCSECHDKIPNKFSNFERR